MSWTVRVPVWYSLFQCSSASRKFLNRCTTSALSVNLTRFSALQRAENSSIQKLRSYERKDTLQGFSALQRAENSSILQGNQDYEYWRKFQCSSASRKFLNISKPYPGLACNLGFSALQRAENSSIMIEGIQPSKIYSFSALQRAENSSISSLARSGDTEGARFSALQRAENSSIGGAHRCAYWNGDVSVLFSEPKIPQ